VVGLARSGGIVEFWSFDPESGVLTWIDVVSPEKQVIGRVRYSDFRTVDGVLEPFEIIDGEGPKRTTIRTSEITNRAVLPAGFFEPSKEERALWQRTEDVLIKYVKACGGSPRVTT
jgi:hypothetical protein